MSSAPRQRTTAAKDKSKDKQANTSVSGSVSGSVPVPVSLSHEEDGDSDSTWVDAALTAFIVLLMLLAVSYLTTHTLHFGLLGPASTGTTRLSFGSRTNSNPNPNPNPNKPNTAATSASASASASASTSTSTSGADSPAPAPGPALAAAPASLLELERQGQGLARETDTDVATGTETEIGTGTGTDTTATATAAAGTGADGKPRKRFRKKKPRGSRTFTLSELAAFDGSDPDKPIYIAIKGHVYDVSAGKQYYGKGSGYNIFAGRDCSRAFLTGCFKERYPGHDLRGLTPEQMKEIDNWMKFYQDHDTYFYVGELILPLVTEDTPLPNEDCSTYDDIPHTHKQQQQDQAQAAASSTDSPSISVPPAAA